METTTHAQNNRISAERLATGIRPELFESRRAQPRVAAGPSRGKGVDQFGLTARERDVLSLMICRQTDAEIADRLFISYRTVTTHVTHIFDKLDAGNRRDAAAIAIRHGLFDELANS
jgi:DNA-binding CsgD family transcriptional regulator